MKKVININFQGRVIPIEETAYDILKQYIESLRGHFAGEEGRDEIINDIEDRIAELFTENLKKGSTCITDTDVNVIINSIGRPEDFEGEETKVQSQLGAESKQQQPGGASEKAQEEQHRERLYRDENDKILGGVCSGLANYLRIDPAILRILFAIITFGGFGTGFLIYILLWIILPSRTLDRGSIRKRLFRNTEDKMIAGVASGIAAYFDIAIWIPRLVFVFPLVAGIFISIFRNIFWDFESGSSIIFGSFGSSLFVIYVILWVVIPEARTASEKLEMRGEKVDLNSIKNTIQEDLGSFKTKAEKWGSEFSQKANQWSKEFRDTVGQKGQQFGTEVSSAAKRSGSRLGNAIGIVFKAFFLFIAGIIAFALLMALLGLLIGGIGGGVSIFPLKSFFLDSFWQNLLAWGTLVFFLIVPVIGLLLWLVRRIMRVKSKRPYLAYVFTGLWTIGWICIVCLAASITRNYTAKTGIEEKPALVQPSKGKLLVNVADEKENYYGDNWMETKYGFHWDDDNAPFYGLSDDSVWLRTVQVRLLKSADSNFHVRTVKLSRGSTPAQARSSASLISFPVQQQDSVLLLPSGFVLTSSMKYHNQQVLVFIEIPVGKKIQLNERVHEYSWFDLNLRDHLRNGRNRRWNQGSWDDEWDTRNQWKDNVEYVMTDKGLKPTHITEEERSNAEDTRQRLKELEEEHRQLEQQQEERKKELEKQQEELRRTLPDSDRYRYQPDVPAKPAVAPKTQKSIVTKNTTDISAVDFLASPGNVVLARLPL